MNKCLKITFTVEVPGDFLRSFIQKNARKKDIEGTVQMMNEKKIRIIACGTKDNVDSFLDIIHKGSANFLPEDVEVEPFIKDKDYRGVFRVIE
jgi:acylphosphatase